MTLDLPGWVPGADSELAPREWRADRSQGADAHRPSRDLL
jgi:hypothetical protein